MENPTRWNESYRIITLLSFALSFSMSIMFFVYIYFDKGIDIWENAENNIFFTIFKILMLAIPLFNLILVLLATRIIDLYDKNVMNNILDHYRDNFSESLESLNSIEKIQRGVLDNMIAYEESLEKMVYKIESIKIASVKAQDCINDLYFILDVSRDIRQVLTEDEILQDAVNFIKIGTGEYQEFFNLIKRYKDGVESILATKAGVLDKDFQSLVETTKKCANDIKFIEAKLQSVITDSKTLQKVLP